MFHTSRRPSAEPANAGNHLLSTHQRPEMLEAIQPIRLMRGDSQSHLMRCSDGHNYVVKFLNNPQHRRVLANEFICTQLAERVGFTVAHAAVVNVDPSVKEEMRFKVENNAAGPQAGLSFGSRYPVWYLSGRVYDYLPPELYKSLRNIREFAGMLAFDKWTFNTDSRQAVYWRTTQQKLYTASFIDFGNSFGADTWRFRDAPVIGVHRHKAVYACVCGWESFEPWISRMEEFPETELRSIISALPPSWGPDEAEIERLISALLERRSGIRAQVLATRYSTVAPFPYWVK